MKQNKYHYSYGNKIPLNYLDMKYSTSSPPPLTRTQIPQGYPARNNYPTRASNPSPLTRVNQNHLNNLNALNRVHPSMASRQTSSDTPEAPAQGEIANSSGKKDCYCNNGLSTGDYPVPFSQTCNAITDGINTCYPYASIVALISMMIQFKNSGITYDVLGNMFDQALTLYNNNTGRPPYFITDYTYAVLRSILVGSYADQFVNSSYPPNYYDRVIASLTELQKRQNDYDYRFQLNGQLICYLVNSLKGIPPNGLSTIYQPNLNPASVEQLSYNSLF